MGGGFGAGFFKGIALSAVIAAVLSLVSPLTPLDPGRRSQLNLPTPAGSGFNAARNDTNPVLPKAEQRVAKDQSPKPEPKQENPSAPVPDTTPPARPAAAGGIKLPPASVGTDNSALLTPPAPDVPVSRPAVLGVPIPTIDNPVAKIPESRVASLKTPPTTKVAAPPPIAGSATAQATLPAKTGSPPAKAAQPQATLPPENLTRAPKIDSAAIRRNRAVFENPDHKPLFSIILIDAGSEGLDNQVLRSFTFPVTFALDPSATGATADAKFLSQAGFEILSLPPSKGNDPTGAALAGAFAKLPESVGLVDWPSAKIQASPNDANRVINALLKSGRGLVTYDIGLNGTNQKARQAGLFSGEIYRVLDSERESGVVIRRYLDRAVLEAQKTGHVIVIAHTYPETVTALFGWALSSRSASVALAPVSAVLLSQ